MFHSCLVRIRTLSRPSGRTKQPSVHPSVYVGQWDGELRIRLRSLATKNIWEYSQYVLSCSIQLHSSSRRTEEGDGWVYLPDGMPISKNVNNETREFVKQSMNRDRQNGRYVQLLIPVRFRYKHPWFQKDHVFYLKPEDLTPIE